jgi:uncharacterized protein YjiS (DUF1127 family)
MTMLNGEAPLQTPRLRDIVGAIAPRRAKFDLFGLAAGYRAYLVYSRLSVQTEEELAQLGLTRADVPRVAMEAIFEKRAA